MRENWFVLKEKESRLKGESSEMDAMVLNAVGEYREDTESIHTINGYEYKKSIYMRERVHRVCFQITDNSLIHSI